MMAPPMGERVATTETQLRDIVARMQRLEDGMLYVIKLVERGKGAWWASRILGTLAIGLWSAVAAVATHHFL